MVFKFEYVIFKLEFDRFQIRGPVTRGQINPFKLLILVLKLMNYVALITEMSFIKLQVFSKMNNLNLKKRLTEKMMLATMVVCR